MCKNLTLIRDVIIKYNPAFIQDPTLAQYAMANPEYFNVERLVEHTLAHVGNLKFVDEAGYDFLPDFSDSKTATVNVNTQAVEINSLENKIGAIRISLYNPIKDGIDYFYVPRAHLARVKQPCYGKSSHKERIKFTYSRVYEDSYGWFDDYRVNSFKALARARG